MRVDSCATLATYAPSPSSSAAAAGAAPAAVGVAAIMPCSAAAPPVAPTGPFSAWRQGRRHGRSSSAGVRLACAERQHEARRTCRLLPSALSAGHRLLLDLDLHLHFCLLLLLGRAAARPSEAARLLRRPRGGRGSGRTAGGREPSNAKGRPTARRW
eukprot:scaffold1425_cov333-Prasinococcus_capsulatus_cf.AAC.2